MTMSEPSILILGAGIFGASTAYHLSLTYRDPSLITIIDRTPFPPSHAASTDINKIIRADYSQRFYMDLAYESMEAWEKWPDLEDEHGRFFHRTGWIMLDAEDSDLAERIRRTFRDRGGDPTSDIDLNDSLRKKWGGMLKETSFEGLKSAYWNASSGWADAGAAVEKMMSESVRRGVKYACGDVATFMLGDEGIQSLRTSDGKVFEAEKIVLCTGAWTSQLLSRLEDELELEEHDRVERQVTAAGVCVAHYKLNDEEALELADMPVVVYSDAGEVLPPPSRMYPAPSGKHVLKYTNAKSFTNTVQTATGHQISVPPAQDQTVVPEKLKEETMENMIKKSMPQYANRPVDYWRLCWDAITPTQDQLITRHPHPRLSNMYLAVGGSFHSWKFLPTIGKYVVNVLEHKSNGTEKDKKWCWKSGKDQGRGAHEKVIPKRELRDLEV
jgi:sarcosine oxidase/L-pipecolate oxidase